MALPDYFNKLVLDGIMKAKTSRTCKRITWCAYRNVLPTKSLMLEKGLISDNTCPCCDDDHETTTHVFLLCDEVKPIWLASPLRFRMDYLNKTKNNVSTLTHWIVKCLDVLNEIEMGVMCAMMWAIWHKRNSWAFSKKMLSNTQVVEKALNACICISNEAEERLSWHPPPSHFIKGNFVTFLKRDLGTGMGLVFRDSCLKIHASATDFLPHYFRSREIAEAECFEWAIRQAIQLGYKNVVFETECEELDTEWKQLTQTEESDCELESLLKECRSMILQQEILFFLRLAPPSANQVALSLAEAAGSDYHGLNVWIGDLPYEALASLQADIMAIADLSFNG